MNNKVDNRTESHNATIHKSGHFTTEQINHLQESATGQEKQIARWFYKHPNRMIGAGMLHELMEYDWPITSTRRSITNLLDAGILEKTSEVKKGLYGSPERLWKWKSKGGFIGFPTSIADNKTTCQSHAEILRRHTGKQTDFHGLWDNKNN